MGGFYFDNTDIHLTTSTPEYLKIEDVFWKGDFFSYYFQIDPKKQ